MTCPLQVVKELARKLTDSNLQTSVDEGLRWLSDIQVDGLAYFLIQLQQKVTEEQARRKG
jgi:hypothetical protein